MLTVTFLKNYQERPLHLMGGLSSLAVVLAASISLFATLTVGSLYSILQIISAAALSAVLPLMAIGFLSELIVSSKDSRNACSAVVEVLNPIKSNNDVLYLSPELPLGLTSQEMGSKALVIDDDPRIRRLLEFQLRELGLEVEHASNGREGLEMIDDSVSLVLLDMMMPELDGLECLQLIKTRNSKAQVIMISANGQTSKAVQAMKNGAFDYIQKPFSPDALEQTIVQALETQRMDDEYRSLRM